MHRTHQGLKQDSSLKKLNFSSGLSRSLVFRLLEPMRLGRLAMTLPEGRTVYFGSDQSEVTAKIHVKNEIFFRKCLLYGDIGFGESFSDGDWDTENITAVISWMILNVENHPTLMESKPKRAFLNFLKFLNNFSHRRRSNTLRGSRKNISEHYDLGNDFFKLFLDPGMTYSSAYFGSGKETLAQAQERKYDELCQKLRLTPADHVLEIGGGWGAFAEHAVKNYGCRVTSITLSKEQEKYCLLRFAREGISLKAEVKICDYREMTGSYDKIASIEMIEAVGHDFLGAYFSQCHRLLKKQGLLGIQAILAPDSRHESFRKSSDWIQKHIFPGGLLPSLGSIQSTIRKTGDLDMLDFEDITNSYARTLRMWRERFLENQGEFFKFGFNELFIRKWNYYFSYCEAAFSMKNIRVAQIIFSRPNNSLLTAFP